MSFTVYSSETSKVRRNMPGGSLGATGVVGFVERSSHPVRPRIAPASTFRTTVASPKHSFLNSSAAPEGAENQKGDERFSSWLMCYSKGLQGQSYSGSFVHRPALLSFTNLASLRTVRPNPSINPDWRDKAAPAGYVKR